MFRELQCISEAVRHRVLHTFSKQIIESECHFGTASFTPFSDFWHYMYTAIPNTFIKAFPIGICSQTLHWPTE